jgi:hypothetical protein
MFELQRHLGFRPILFEFLQIMDKGHFYEGRLPRGTFI